MKKTIMGTRIKCYALQGNSLLDSSNLYKTGDNDLKAWKASLSIINPREGYAQIKQLSYRWGN